MNQTKSNNVDVVRADSKRERRRVPTGRAAVLRRAPSDSDCSGETASLSADSGERAIRPPPPPPRATKSRSRRRGSEWEVLEGLKDGQRFEKRPDVFNGYLHKKRKWPLKGWHKRYFVVDAGILVYARSPADVGRGRLHGSVDVGLSVISAKARRRRIDIDADEFIYHLRAKTPDLFRTWLNVLKAHRLYRQHLLTFGARESVPKIHTAPTDDLPATDTSSHTSFSSSTVTSNVHSNLQISVKYSPDNDSHSLYCHKADNSLHKWQQRCPSKSYLEPLDLEENMFDLKLDDGIFRNRSLCSMNCVTNTFTEFKSRKSPDLSMNSTNAEKQMVSTDLSSLMADLESNLEKLSLVDTGELLSNDVTNQNLPFFPKVKVPTTTACCFFFTRKKHNEYATMRRSKKCTNLVRYQNLSEEPPLKMPSSRCMLLTKYKTQHNRNDYNVSVENKAIVCKIKSNDVKATQVEVTNANKASQNAMTSLDYDRITEKLMVSIFKMQAGLDTSEIECYIDNLIRDLYDLKLDQHTHPVKALFRCLLEYWLKNTSKAQFKEAMTCVKFTEKPSNQEFTKDKNLSSILIHNPSKQTQCFKHSDVVRYIDNKNTNARHVSKATKCEKNNPPKCSSPKRDTESFEKELRIQKLERLLKNTVYICETQRNSRCREKDINITKKLIDNLEKGPKYSEIDNTEKPLIDKSASSTELPAIQDTINHLISDSQIPPDFAKEFLGAYLDVLLNNESKSTTTSQSSDWSTPSKDVPICQVQAESVVKKVSKSMTTLEAPNKITANLDENAKQIDPGQVYLKDVLDKITTIFSKAKKSENSWEQNKLESQITQNKEQKLTKDLFSTPVKISSKNVIYQNSTEKSLVVDLSKYNLEELSMFNDPLSKGVMSIIIKLKEKPNSDDSKQTHLNMKFADDVKPIITPVDKSDNWISYTVDKSDSRDMFIKSPKTYNQPFINVDADKEFIDLKPYLSTSEATSKAYRFLHESNHSIDDSIKSSESVKDITTEKKENEDTQSCYIMSFNKGPLTAKLKSQVKKNALLKETAGAVTIAPREEANKVNELPIKLLARKPEELSIFEKPVPRIIDEKFILLLLENLMVLSKNVPTLFKDISSLHSKLRKKYDKVVKNCSNIQGLSLLGKIYNDESYVSGSNNKTTEMDSDIAIKINTQKENISCGTNTVKNVSDKDVLTSMSEEPIISELENKTDNDITTLNENIDLEEPKASTSKKERMTVTQTENVDIDSIDHATSIPNWIAKITKDCSMSTVIKYVLDNDSTYNFRLTPAKPLTYEPKELKKKRHSPRTKQDLIREISLLSPSFKVSTESQTDRCLMRLVSEKKNFDVYQLYVSQKFGLKGSSSVTVANVEVKKSDDMHTLYRCASDPSNVFSGLISPTSPTLRGPQAGFVSGTPGGRLAGWIIESGGPLENATRELGQAQLSVQQLQRLLDALELQQQVHHDTDVSLEGASPNVKKDRRKFGLRKKKSNSKCASVELAPPLIDPSSSHSALSALTAPPSPGGGASSIPNSAASLPIACAAARPQSLPGAESMATIQAGPASLTSLTPDHQLREDFTVLAKDLVASLKGVVSTLVCERSRLRAAMEAADSTSIPGNASMAALRTNLTSALHQNSELRSRLSRIHDASDIAEITDASQRAFQQSLSYSSSCVSASEFFDAEEHEDEDEKPEIVIGADEAGVIELDGDSSSEAGSISSEEGSASSDNSDGAMLSAEAVTLRHEAGAEAGGAWSRRTRLPAPRPAPGGPSLWNLLYKNIGKDLSQISMPVTINEPLNMLQRLCEELEYSELLDAAAECKSAVERMALVAAFAVSAYAASAHRAASKPFNPLLGETYECVRDDRGFRFLAEQVSHHPPISACQAESPRWCFWQEARIKTKFWGKSMEFQPTGRVHVRLNTTGDHYTWNKVTTCVHNLFGGQRWVDQYGDMHIACVGTDISCKLQFIKASSWSQSRHEVRGAISSGRGSLRLSGRWSEALYAGDPPAARCLWRPGAMPPDHEIYYGFTRFAMELNEMEPGMRETLPHTDTRLRPDQRALEEGLVDAAERLKHELEQSQRERRRDNARHTPAWFRKSIDEGEEMWVFSGEYWKARAARCGGEGGDGGGDRIW